MATRKLSQIAAAAANFTSSDFIVAVQAGTTDVRYTNAQMFGAITAATVTQANAATTSVDGLTLINTSTASAGNQQYSPRIRLTGQGWRTDGGGASEAVDWIIENNPREAADHPFTDLSFYSQINGGGYTGIFSIIHFANIAQASVTLNSASTSFYDVSVFGTTHGRFYTDASQCVFGSPSNIPVVFITNNISHFSIATSGVMTGSFTPAANTSTDGLVLTDPTAATAGNQRYSPWIRLTGQGWKTDATAASQTVDWSIENRPSQGAASPDSYLLFLHQVNGTGYNVRASLLSNNNGNQVTFAIDQTGSSQFVCNVGGVASAALYVDSTQVISGAIINVPLKFISNNTTRAYIPAASGFVVGSGAAALATNATDGFLYIPTCAGTPTGTPTAQTGTVAMVFDTTNNKLYIYDGSWLGGTTPGAWT